MDTDMDGRALFCLLPWPNVAYAKSASRPSLLIKRAAGTPAGENVD